jgi:uncharacterized surface protein with fasciclin (FAS1) repeats
VGAEPIEEASVNQFRRAALGAAIGIVLYGAEVPMLAAAELAVEVGGARMVASRTIVANLGASNDHRMLVAAIEAADLVGLLQGAGPFTIFAPTDKAFAELPKGAAASLLASETKEKLVALLSMHIVEGRYGAADLVVAAAAAQGEVRLPTLGGGELVVTHDGRKLTVVDAEGGKASVVIPDVDQRNGVVHVVDRVLLPRG